MWFVFSEGNRSQPATVNDFYNVCMRVSRGYVSLSLDTEKEKMWKHLTLSSWPQWASSNEVEEVCLTEKTLNCHSLGGETSVLFLCVSFSLFLSSVCLSVMATGDHSGGPPCLPCRLLCSCLLHAKWLVKCCTSFLFNYPLVLSSGPLSSLNLSLVTDFTAPA